jgi:hypothetical protein
VERFEEPLRILFRRRQGLALSSGEGLHVRTSTALAGVVGFMLVSGSALSAAYGIPFIRSAPALLLVVFFALHALSGGELRPLTAFHKLALCLLALLAAGILHTRSPLSGSVKTGFVLLYWVLFGIAFFNVFTSRRHIEVFLIGLGLGGIGYAFLLWFFEGNPLDILSGANVFFRLALSDSQNPIYLGRSMGLSIVVLLWFLSDRPLGRLSFLALPALPLALGYLVATGSKGPIIGTVIAAGVFAAVRASRWGRVVAIVCLSLLVGLLVQGLVQSRDDSVVRSRLLETGPASFERRMDSWSVAYEGLTRGSAVELLLGHGTGDFSHLAVADDARAYPHNLFLEALYELGLLGAGALLGLLVAPIVMFRRMVASNGGLARREIRGLAATAFALYAFAIVNAQVSGDLSSNEFIPVAGTILVAMAGGGWAGSSEATLAEPLSPATAEVH